MKNILTSRKALMFFSLALVGNALIHALPTDSFFAPFNELFEAMDRQPQPTKNLENAEKDLMARVTSLQGEAKRLSKAADDLAVSLDKKSLSDSAVLATLDDSHAAIDSTLRSIRRELQVVHQARCAERVKQAQAHSLRTKSDDTKSLFVITATLPDIAKEDLKITVQTSDEFGMERQTLLITAEAKKTKDAIEVARHKKAADKDTGQQQMFSSSIVRQARYLNGRREELTADNGNITITVDLPKDANNDLAEVQKTMTFENNILVLSFPISERTKKKETELRFAVPTKAPETTRAALK